MAWDPDATSSCWHGVTSVVLGNCGVTFAPVRKGQERWLAELMESVEDIPADAILQGLSWNWETYGEYLAAIDALPKGVNVGGMVGHCAVRHFAMGDRSLDETPATDDDIAAMCDLVDEAMGAGALGFSTSRTLLHRVPDGRPVPGTWADERELLAIADVLGRRGHGVYEVAPRFERPGANYEGTRAEMHWMAEINRRTGRPVTFGLAQSNAGPELFRKILELVDEEGAAGGELRPQTTARGIGLLFGLQHRTFFDRAPRGPHCKRCRSTTRLVALRDDARRAELLAEAEDGTLRRSTGTACTCSPPTRSTTPPIRETSLAAHAQRNGETHRGGVRHASRSRAEGRALFNYPFLNQRMDAVEELLDHPQMAIGLGDSGAHVGLIMDASLPTWFLLHWVRDRAKYTIQDAIRRMTSDTADLFGDSRTRRAARRCVRRRQRARSRRARPAPPGVRPRLPGGRGSLRAARRRLPHDDRQRRRLRRPRRADRCARRTHVAIVPPDPGMTRPDAPYAGVLTRRDRYYQSLILGCCALRWVGNIN